MWRTCIEQERASVCVCMRLVVDDGDDVMLLLLVMMMTMMAMMMTNVHLFCRIAANSRAFTDCTV